MTRAAVAFVVALAALPAAADEGELHVDAVGCVEAAWLRHPLTTPALLPDAQTAFAIVSRLGAGARFDITNEVRAGSALTLAAATNLTTNGVSIGGVAGQLITGGYFEAALPLSLAWRLDSGFDISGVTRLDVGPTITWWSGNAFADPQKVDADGRPARLPFDVKDALQPALALRISLAIELRLLNTISLSAMPYVGISWSGSAALSVGVAVQPAVVVDVGPL